MKKLSKKGVLLFAGAMAVCAFVLPSMASASSWGPIGGAHHVLNTPNIGFTGVLLGAPTTSSCTQSSFTAVVLNAADMQIRAGTFGGLCTASSAAIGTCTVTATPTRFPWTATATTTSNLQIHGIHIDIRFEQPRNGTNSCLNVNGADITLTGTLTNARYLGPGRIDLANGHGLVTHSVLGNNNPVTALGQLSDASATPITVTG